MRPVLLVGSVPLEDAATVFSAAAKALGPLAARLPDGETGARRNWIGWQHAVFARVPQLEPTAERQRNYQLHPPFKLKPGAVAPDIDFGELGFAREALASWEIFERLKATGRVPAGCKFQVALPTAWAPVYSFIAYESQAAVAPVYDVAELMADPQVTAREMITTVADEALGTVRMQNVLYRMSETPGAIRFTGRPLGADTDAVLGEELGVDSRRLTALRERGVVA